MSRRALSTEFLFVLSFVDLGTNLDTSKQCKQIDDRDDHDDAVDDCGDGDTVKGEGHVDDVHDKVDDHDKKDHDYDAPALLPPPRQNSMIA